MQEYFHKIMLRKTLILGVSVIFNQILGFHLAVPTCCALAHSESETRLTGSTAHMMIYLMQASYLEVA